VIDILCPLAPSFLYWTGSQPVSNQLASFYRSMDDRGEVAHERILNNGGNVDGMKRRLAMRENCRITGCELKAPMPHHGRAHGREDIMKH